MAQALVDSYLDSIVAYSCGTNPKKNVNPNVIKLLKANGIYNSKYYPKDISKVTDIEFDLVVTVCDNAKQNCPVFPKPIPTIHVGFEDPDGKEYIKFQETYLNIKDILLPKINNTLLKDMQG
jgi:arsenate reductase